MNNELEGEYIPHEDAEDESVSDDLSNEGLLNFTQKIRKELVSGMTTKGMPEDKDDRSTLLQALRDMDQTSVNRLRLDVDQENNESNRAAQEIVRRLYDVNPYGLRAKPGEERDELPIPPDSEIPEIEFDEGEKAIGLVTETADEFLKRMEDSSS